MALHHAVKCKRYFDKCTVKAWITSVTDWQTDRQTNGTACSIV